MPVLFRELGDIGRPLPWGIHANSVIAVLPLILSKRGGVRKRNAILLQFSIDSRRLLCSAPRVGERLKIAGKAER